MQAERILQIIVDWAKKQPTIQAVAVVGSHARGTARAESDIDLVLLATNPRAFPGRRCLA
jgi:predicted nucleotidyltransferase